MKTLIIFILALITITLGCERMPSLPPDTQAPAPEITIGVHVPLTGTWGEVYGLPMKRGFELARKEINASSLLQGLHLSFITIDDQSTPDGATRAVQELVDHGVPAIVGLGISSHLVEAAPIAQANGVIAFSSLSSAAGLSQIGDFVFRTPLALDRLIPPSIAVTHEKLSYQTAALIYDAIDVYSTSSNVEIDKALTANGVEILTTQTFQTGDTDFTEQLEAIKTLAPDVIFVSGLSAEIVEILIEGHDLDIPDTVDIIVPEMSADEMRKAGSAAEGVITILSWSDLTDTPGNSDFIASYQSEYGIAPEPWAAQSYATVYILVNAITEARSTAPAAIRDALAATQDFPTILGNFSFDPNGEAIYDPIVLRVSDGELHLFE